VAFFQISLKGDTIMDLEVKFRKLWDISKEYLKQGREVDLPHTRVSVDFGLRLINEEGGDKDIIVPAIILHDIGYSVMDEENLYQRTTYVLRPKEKKTTGTFSKRLKEMHMVEGAKLAKKILRSLEYEERLVDEIVHIVRNHEDSSGKPKTGDTNLNQLIVGEADRLFRVTHINFSHLMKFHGATEEEVFSYFMEMKDPWYLTRSAQLIAEEEIRKIANSHLLPGLF